LLKPRWSVGPAIGGRNRYWQESFSHLQVLHNPLRHMAETNLDALRRIGIQPGLDERTYTLVPGEAAEAKLRARLADFGLQGNDFIHIHPASRWFFKCWPVPPVWRR
jgi:heptosyltransferase-3